MGLFIFVLLLLPDTPLYLLECTTDDDIFQNQGFNFEQSKKIYILFFLLNKFLLFINLEFYKSVNFYHGNNANISEIRDEAYDRWNVEMNINEYLYKSKENLKV